MTNETPIQITMTGQDFADLAITGGPFKAQNIGPDGEPTGSAASWLDGVEMGRFSAIDGSGDVLDHETEDEQLAFLSWDYYACLPDDAAAMILARAYLRARGREHVIYHDEHYPRTTGGYLVLFND